MLGLRILTLKKKTFLIELLQNLALSLILHKENNIYIKALRIFTKKTISLN
jgi:hypothetical protein